ncbi:MAG TPA: hypothetical protein VFQ42_04265 [Mycobacterium sp.]|nr:hypothetical protein [Mycobacterium sp.]
MTAATLAILADHIEQHSLPWHNITTGENRPDIKVQLAGNSADDLVRWASTLDSLTWRIDDGRDSKVPGWYAYTHGVLDGAVTAWGLVPSDLGDTAAEVEQVMRDRLAAYTD